MKKEFSTIPTPETSLPYSFILDSKSACLNLRIDQVGSSSAISKLFEDLLATWNLPGCAARFS